MSSGMNGGDAFFVDGTTIDWIGDISSTWPVLNVGMIAITITIIATIRFVVLLVVVTAINITIV
jgi:hypothetical protein